jgi:putative transposase
MKPTRHPRYARHRFPPEVISHVVWLYCRFPLSLRMVEGMLTACGIVVSHEPVRQWALKFGQSFANQIRRRLPAPGANGILMVCHEHISEGGDVELYKR